MCHRDPADRGWCDQHDSDYPRDEDLCGRAAARLTMDSWPLVLSDPVIVISERELDVMLPRAAR